MGTEERPQEMESKTVVQLPQAKGRLEPPEAGRSNEGPSPGLSEGA